MLKAELRCWPARRLPGTLLKQPDIYIYIYTYMVLVIQVYACERTLPNIFRNFAKLL